MAMSDPRLVAELQRAIEKHNLAPVAEEIFANAAECYAIVAVGRDDYSSTGNTRLGGDPDLPQSLAWPQDAEGKSANFIAQINFAELPPVPSGNLLPPSGVLYLFVREMDAAAYPVELDAVYFDGNLSSLARRPSPDEDELCDEYLVDLVPQRVQFVPAISLASYRKDFRRTVAQRSEVINGDDGDSRRIDLEASLRRPGQIGNLLGFANAGDERDNLYRNLVFGRLDKRSLMFNDYWDSMEEYEAYIERYKDEIELANDYRKMRPGVEWLTSNREAISAAVAEWRLLLRLDSNSPMDLNINDADPLYVFIREVDLANRVFSNLAGEVTQG